MECPTTFRSSTDKVVLSLFTIAQTGANSLITMGQERKAALIKARGITLCKFTLKLDYSNLVPKDIQGAMGHSKMTQHQMSG